jgi:hypothetical protein
MSDIFVYTSPPPATTAPADFEAALKRSDAEPGDLALAIKAYSLAYHLADSRPADRAYRRAALGRIAHRALARQHGPKAPIRHADALEAERVGVRAYEDKLHAAFNHAKS